MKWFATTSANVPNRLRAKNETDISAQIFKVVYAMKSISESSANPS